MSKGKTPNLMLFVKLGSSPPSLAVLEHIHANIHVFKRFCRIRITAFTPDELQNPRILEQLEDYGISGLPALLTNKDNVLFGVESIIKYIHPVNFKTVKEEKQEKQRQAARRFDDDDLLSEWNTRMMNVKDQEEHDKDLKKDITAKQSEDLRDDRLTGMINRARKTAPSSDAPVTSVEKINKARYGNSSGKQRGGPERSRDTAPPSELNETVSGLDMQQKQRLKQKFANDDDDIHGIKPPGRNNGASIRDKALQGASQNRAQRSNNLDSFDDEDAVDKMLKSISKNKGLD